jgi:hypothetical protein
MYSDYVQSSLANTYQAERVAVARRERLLKQACCYRPALRQRFLAWSGDRLIALGQTLKERHEPLPLPALADLAPENGAKIET